MISQLILKLRNAAFTFLVAGVVCAQTPPPTVLLQVDAKISDAAGTPWTGEVMCRAKFLGTAHVSQALRTPNATGEASFALAPGFPTVDSKAVVLEFWPSNVVASGATSLQFFLVPSDGVAAFPPLQNPIEITPGVYQMDVTATMSAPGIYGTINFNVPTNQSLRLSVADFRADRTLSLRYLKQMGHRVDLPIGTSTVSLYRWSRVAASDFIVEGPQGVSVAFETLRRSGSLAITLPRENTLSVFVSASQFPNAARLILVKPQHHDPNPNGTGAPYEKFDAQIERCVFDCPVDMNGSAFATARAYVEGAYVLELWGHVVLPSGAKSLHLLDHVSIVSAPSDVSVNFD